MPTNELTSLSKNLFCSLTLISKKQGTKLRLHIERDIAYPLPPTEETLSEYGRYRLCHLAVVTSFGASLRSYDGWVELGIKVPSDSTTGTHTAVNYEVTLPFHSIREEPPVSNTNVQSKVSL